MQQLDGDVSLEARIMRREDDAHAPCAEASLQHVAPHRGEIWLLGGREQRRRHQLLRSGDLQGISALAMLVTNRPGDVDGRVGVYHPPAPRMVAANRLRQRNFPRDRRMLRLYSAPNGEGQYRGHPA